MLPLFSLLLLAPLTVTAHRIHHLPRQQQSGSCTAVSNVQFSNYGFPDASGLTQYSCNGDQQVSGNVATPLGDGTADNPYSAALSDTATAFKKCETVYIPYFQKYFKFVDICAQCQTDQSSSILHIDLYLIQSDADIGQTSCELSFGVFGNQEFTVLRNPPFTLPYSATPLFDNGQCNSGAVFADGANDAGACSGSGGGGGGGGSSFGVIAPTSQVDGSQPVQTSMISTTPVIGTALPVNTYTSNLVLESSGIPYVPVATGTGGGGGGNGGSGTGTLAGFPGRTTGMPQGGWYHHHGGPPKVMRRVKR